MKKPVASVFVGVRLPAAVVARLDAEVERLRKKLKASGFDSATVTRASVVRGMLLEGLGK